MRFWRNLPGRSLWPFSLLAATTKLCRTKDKKRASFETSSSVRFWSPSVTGTTRTSWPAASPWHSLISRSAIGAAACPWFTTAASSRIFSLWAFSLRLSLTSALVSSTMWLRCRSHTVGTEAGGRGTCVRGTIMYWRWEIRSSPSQGKYFSCWTSPASVSEFWFLRA